MEVKKNKPALNKFLEECSNSVFHEKIIPSKKIIDTLKIIYPTIKWERVYFFKGMPWFTIIHSNFITAQALPATYSFSKFSIYLRDYDAESCETLSIIVHEGYHLMQYQKFLKGYGLGFLRAFIVYYNAYYLKHGYRNNPFEIPAYEQENKFYRFCKSNSLLQKESFSVDTCMIVKGVDFKFTGNYFYLFLSLLFNLLIAIIKPIAEILLALHLKLLKGITKIY